MKVTVYKERLLKGDSKHWGSQHENLATTLFFDFPEYVEKNGEEIPTAGLNKYIVFDISRPDNQDVIKDGKYSFPHEITKLGTITFWVKLEEPSESEDMSDKLIWISKGLTVSFNKNAEGQIEITNEKLDTFNSLVTTLNLETKKVEDLVTEIETKLENGEFNGQDYVLTDEDRKEIKTEVEKDVQPTLENNLKSAKDYTDNAIVRDFKDITFDETTMTIVFTRHDNTTFTIDLPIENTVKNGRYDAETQELVLILVSGQEIKIPASGLIDDYDGVETATIQCVVSADNKISCNIKAGSITKTLLTTELQEEIDGKLNKSAFVYDEATETLSITI